MSHSVNVGAFASGTMDAAADTVVFRPSKDTSTFKIIVVSATDLVGMVLRVDVQYVEGGAWYEQAFYLSNETGAGHTHAVATAALSAVPAYTLCVHVGTVLGIRARASALTSGSAVVRVVPSYDHSY